MGKTKFSFPVRDEQFKKSSRSLNDGGNGGHDTCVLVAKTKAGVALRDSKDPQKRTLFFDHKEFDVFRAAVKSGEFD
jgi:hypothetical protein